MDDSLLSKHCPHLTLGWLAYIPVGYVVHSWLRWVSIRATWTVWHVAHHAAGLTWAQHHCFAFIEGLSGLSHQLVFLILFRFPFKHQPEEDASERKHMINTHSSWPRWYVDHWSFLNDRCQYFFSLNSGKMAAHVAEGCGKKLVSWTKTQK